MFWRLFKLQELLDALFDDGWLGMGLTPATECRGSDDADLPVHQA